LKATGLDYLLSGVAITLLLAAAILGVFVCLPWSKSLFADYHVVTDFLLGLLLFGLFSALLVRILLAFRPMPHGTFDMDSSVFTYWKLITIVYRLGQSALKPFTPVFLKPLIEMLFGARIGRDVALGGVIDDPFMVSVGDGSVLGNASLVSGNYINDGALICGPVTIGKRVTVGANSVIFPNSDIGDDVILAGGSYVMPGTKIPAGETWRGNPARKWIQHAGVRPAVPN
jgi:serine acetyltransferase